MRKLSLILAVLFAVMIPVWIFVITPRIVLRIPADWNWQAKHVGYVANPDPAKGGWEEDVLAVYDREKNIVDWTSERAEIKDRYANYDPVSGKATFEYITGYIVNPKDGMNVEGKDRANYRYVFPLHTEKKSYTLSSDYIKKVPLSFVKEDQVEGLDVYLFEFKGVTEYTECYQRTADYPGVVPPNGQEIRSLGSFILRYWVEPVSGEIIVSEEDSPEGDWVVDAQTGKKISPVMRWGGRTTGDAVIQMVNSARQRSRAILFKERFVPAGLGILAVIFGLVFLAAKKGK